MKKIGEGWQYTVYDLGNGRVLKKYHSTIKSYWIIFKTIFPFRDDSFFEIKSFSKEMEEKVIRSFQILKENKMSNEWIGNPNFLNQLDFEQDKVRPLSEVFKETSLEQNKVWVNKFIDFNRQLIKTGIIDKSFNITKNFGINSKGEVILIDIGELVSGPKQIKEQIKNRIWTKHYIAGCIEDPNLREYFISEMHRFLLEYL